MEERAEEFRLLIVHLRDSAIKGDVPSLLNLYHIDPFILDRCMTEKSGCFMQSPLHIAANLGHLEFTKEIICRKPELAEELDHLKRWSPLHMASAKVYLEIVEALLVVNSNMCFTRDQDGRNPVHVAAIYGQIHVLDKLLKARPQAALERTNDGDTVLHLCVKLSQPQALMFLANVAEDDELLNSKDGNGNTVLHLAVSAKQLEVKMK